VRLLGVREDVPTLLAAASVHCLPSRPEQKEGFTVATLEAKRAGLPSVVTQCGALPEMIQHKVDGWICSDVTPQEVAAGLSYFLEDTNRARLAGEAARASERAFNHARFSAEWGEVFSVGQSAVVATAHTRPS
jgi:glycosyltransferase involved in cell wall biosynthesis